MLKRIACEDRESWLIARGQQGIGGSEAAAVIGVSPWATPLELWRQKTGQAKAKDLSGNAAVEQGVRMEPILRDFFAATHPEYQVEYHQYDILFQEERPWLFATLDAELIDADGRRGILEIKTSTPTGAKWRQWADGHVPQQYAVQVIHQLLATGYDFAILFAALFSMDGTISIKPPYEFERIDHEEDLSWLLEQETRFYERNIIGGAMPSMPLVL